MAQNANTACLYTSLRNASGKERFFGFIGPRGKTLAPNEVVTVRGNLVSTLGAMTSARRFQALERSLDQHQSLEIVYTPAVHLYDPVTERTRVLALQGGVLGLVDPCWDSSGSSDFATADAEGSSA